MIRDKQRTIHIALLVAANLLVLCLCAVIWIEVVRDLTAYEEQIVTNEVPFHPQIDWFQHYSWSIDVPDEVQDVSIQIVDTDGAVVFATQAHCEDADDIGAFAPMTDLETPITLEPGAEYTVSFYLTDGSLYGERASLALYGAQTSLKAWYAVICVLALLVTNLAGMLLLRIGAESNRRTGIITVIILLLLGALTMTIYEPFSVPDETTHFTATYNLMGSLLPGDMRDDYAIQSVQTGIWKDMGSLPVGQQIYSFWYDWEYGNESIMQETRTFLGYANYPTYGYLPAVIGVMLIRLLSLPYQLLLVAGRVCNYAMFLLLAFLSCRIAPDLRMAILAIAGLPSVIWLAASYSYDGWNLGFSMLFVAYVWHITTRDKGIGIREILLMVMLLLAFAPIKYIYVLLAMIVLAIPGRKWNNRRMLIAAIVVGGIGVIVVLRSRLAEAVQLLMTSQSDIRGLEQGLTGTSYTVGYCIRHPLEIALVFARTFYTDLETMIERLLVGEFYSGYVPAYLTVILGILFMMLLLMATRASLEGRNHTGRGTLTAWIYRGVFLLGVLAIYGSFLFLYSYYNEGQIGLISGVQGRYFLPLLLLLPIGGSARMAVWCDRLTRERHMESAQLWAAYMYVGLLVMLCRMIGFVNV